MLYDISIALKLPLGLWKKLVLFGLSAFFIYFGVDHFINPDFYLSIMPPSFPLHEEAVYISGFFEIVGGIGVLIPRFRKIAGWGLVALLIAVIQLIFIWLFLQRHFQIFQLKSFIFVLRYNFYFSIGLTQ